MLNHSSAVPKYIQLAEKLEEMINNGEIKADERLFSENELCQKYNVSRITVRQAFRLLETKDLIYTVHGKGTFVKMPTLSHSLPEIVTFSKMLSAKGLVGRTQIKSFHIDSENDKAKNILGLSSADKLFNLNLLGCVETSPVALYKSYFNMELGEKMHWIAVEMEKSGNPFTTLDLYEKTGIRLSHVEQTITAEAPSAKLGELLSLPHASALVVLESIFYDTEGVAVEYKKGYYRSDIYSFKMTRKLS